MPAAPIDLNRAFIRIRGARVHNLRNVSIDLPRGQLIVLTGVSGSGKSSLAFDTVFAEGQRRYLESVSIHTRQILDQLERPDVDLIDGLPPTIAVDQHQTGTSARSTLATTTEIFDYLRLLFARAGEAHCFRCGRPVTRQTAAAIVEQILSLDEGRKVMLLAPLVRGRKGKQRDVFEQIVRDGFVRARVNGDIVDAAAPPDLAQAKTHKIEAVVDRIVVKEGIRPRLQESVRLALIQGNGECLVSWQDGASWRDTLYSENFACPDCQLSFPELQPRSFSFNSPYGACPACTGLGTIAETAAKSNEPDSGAEADRRVLCPECRGSRLNPFSSRVTFAGHTLSEVTARTVEECLASLQASRQQLADDSSSEPRQVAIRKVTERILPEILSRLQFLKETGLDYLTLDRPTETLSGGEFQRARLAACLGTGLTGVCYVLDEPTIGLHPRDTERLIGTLEKLRRGHATVIVVEHDLDVIRRADYLVDLGPGAGAEGGEIIAAGSPEEVENEVKSVTGNFLRDSRRTFCQRTTRPADPSQGVRIRGARLHNLQSIDVELPLGVFAGITGVSGSGKSSLVVQTLVPAIRAQLEQQACDAGGFTELSGVEKITRLVEVDQSPIGRTVRSTPATFSGLWDEVRKAFARTRTARLRGFTPRRFSFNARSGWCPECKGRGAVRLNMQFLPEMHVTCRNCRGTRFNPATLSIRLAGKNVADILQMRCDEAAEFFRNYPKLATVLNTFCDVGLGYLQLGQPAMTLSGGEAQRVKLATELAVPATGHTLFVLDEPTTGLHPADIERLLSLLNRLIDAGQSVWVIEHELQVIEQADWIVDLGPEGGGAGGRMVAAGTPADIMQSPNSHTGRALRLRSGQEANDSVEL